MIIGKATTLRVILMQILIRVWSKQLLTINNLDVLAITSELGYAEDGIYYEDEHCSENLLTMIEMLDGDDPGGFKYL